MTETITFEDLRQRARRIAKTQPIQKRAEKELLEVAVGAFALGVVRGRSIDDPDSAAEEIMNFAKSFST